MRRIACYLGIAILLLAGLGFPSEFDNTRTFTAGEAIATAGLRVKLSGVSVVKAGSAELDIGTVTASVAANLPVGVKLARTGTRMMVASKAITAGTAVYGAAAGKVSDAVAGHRIGYALTASAADGDAIEVLRVPFTATTTGDVTLDANANLAAAAGTGAVDFSGATGTFKTSTGANTIGGDTTLAAGKNLVAAAGAGAVDFSSATGTFKTSTGANTLSGDTTVAAGKLLGVTDGGSTAISTGAGSVKMTTANAANSAVWIPIKYNGTTYYVPGWTSHAP